MVVVPGGWGATLFTGMIAGFLVVALELGFEVGIAYGAFAVLVCSDGTVSRDVGGCVWIRVPSVEVVELGLDGVVTAQYPFQRRGVGFADCFAVPACAL